MARLDYRSINYWQRTFGARQPESRPAVVGMPVRSAWRTVTALFRRSSRNHSTRIMDHGK